MVSNLVRIGGWSDVQAAKINAIGHRVDLDR